MALARSPGAYTRQSRPTVVHVSNRPRTGETRVLSTRSRNYLLVQPHRAGDQPEARGTHRRDERAPVRAQPWRWTASYPHALSRTCPRRIGAVCSTCASRPPARSAATSVAAALRSAFTTCWTNQSASATSLDSVRSPTVWIDCPPSSGQLPRAARSRAKTASVSRNQHTTPAPMHNSNAPRARRRRLIQQAARVESDGVSPRPLL